MGVKKVIKAYTIKEVIDALNENIEESTVIAGGTDLMIKLREGTLLHSILVDVSDVNEMKGISITSEAITLGASVTFSEIVKSEEIKKALPGFWEACSMVGAVQIRNMGTLGGNTANGSPAADSVPPLIALGAKLIISSLSGDVAVDISDFFIGKGNTALPKGSVIKEFIIPMQGKGSRIIAFDKLGLRNALAISRISSAVCLNVEGSIITEARVASGSIGILPTFEDKMSKFLIGKTLNEDTINEAAKHFSFIVSERLKGRSSLEFKKEAVKGVIIKTLTKALSQINSQEGLENV
ncbi:FAD binding domain-containing protein [Clostridium cylindrosporum]|uniref:Nicotinate dehydrogenase FAD-subunit n=1 Tax=Clostridium cylindrosporum DSM 605 TaxID=1121307 RepID=A0A0J8D7X3_CLOCY|nr:FAD binding domain-containing protein [Clostridium cylindrosporum]KMT22145.1 nicotinate dehydrogenase FAD-subunit [Clostridium cylindrosporum DSM 605]